MLFMKWDVSMAKKKAVDVVEVVGGEDLNIEAPSKIIPVSKKEKERLISSYTLTLLIAGRGMRHKENYQLPTWEENE